MTTSKEVQIVNTDLGYKENDFPVSEKLSKTILNIPMHPYLTDDQIEFISRNAKKIFK